LLQKGTASFLHQESLKAKWPPGAVR